jgi:hypothetical protein
MDVMWYKVRVRNEEIEGLSQEEHGSLLLELTYS